MVRLAAWSSSTRRSLWFGRRTCLASADWTDDADRRRVDAESGPKEVATNDGGSVEVGERRTVSPKRGVTIDWRLRLVCVVKGCGFSADGRWHSGWRWALPGADAVAAVDDSAAVHANTLIALAGSVPQGRW